MTVFEIIISILMILLISLVALNIYLSLKSDSNEDDTKDDELSDLNELIKHQGFSIKEQSESVRRTLEKLSEFNYPMEKLTRYLSGGTLAGTFGEWGLEAILRDVIPENRLKSNYEVIPNSGNRVEFVIELDNGLLPLDSKFPSGLYDAYLNTYKEAANSQSESARSEVNRAINQIRGRVKSDAEDIQTKYLQRGITMDFGVMFIPSESLMQLIDRLQEDATEISTREYIFKTHRILMVGPNSLAAFVMSLAMGMRIESMNENAEEILKKFGKFEHQFRLFENSMEDIKKKADSVVKGLEKSDVRVRAMNRAINQMEELREEED